MVVLSWLIYVKDKLLLLDLQYDNIEIQNPTFKVLKLAELELIIKIIVVAHQTLMFPAVLNKMKNLYTTTIPQDSCSVTCNLFHWMSSIGFSLVWYLVQTQAVTENCQWNSPAKLLKCCSAFLLKFHWVPGPRCRLQSYKQDKLTCHQYKSDPNLLNLPWPPWWLVNLLILL